VNKVERCVRENIFDPSKGMHAWLNVSYNGVRNRRGEMSGGSEVSIEYRPDLVEVLVIGGAEVSFH
jgi:hypothetical protein